MAVINSAPSSHTFLSPVSIWDIRRKESVWAVFCAPPSKKNFDQLEAVRLKTDIFYSSPISRIFSVKPGPADHWSWLRKYSTIKGKKPYLIGVIESPNGNGKKRYEGVQGAMLLDLSTSPNSHLNILEVKYIAAAPHNISRKYFTVKLKPKYSVGVALMKVAVQESIRCGFGGNLGLYALPEAEPFYEKIGLTKFDHLRDPEGLVYFEGICNF